MSSALQEYAKSVSWRDINGGKDTVEYLHNPIHDPNVQNYYKRNIGNWEADVLAAKKLQGYLQDIKNYEKGIKVEGESHLSLIEYEALRQSLTKIRGVRGVKADQILFSTKEQTKGGSQHAFEEQMADLNIAIIDTLTGSDSSSSGLQGLKNKQYNILLGQSKVNWDISLQQLTSDLVQYGLEAAKVKTIKKFKEIEEKSHRSDQNFYTLVKVDGKVDLATASAEVTEIVNTQYKHLNELNNLFKDATFTLKNYSKSTERTKLGSTNIFRVVFTTVQYFTGNSNQQVLAYTSALAIRQATDASVAGDINSHLGHLQRVYELTGVGQEYVNIQQKELRDLLRQGAKFMIENVYNSDQIHVASTKELLAKMLESDGSNHFSQTVRMARKVFENIKDS